MGRDPGKPGAWCTLESKVGFSFLLNLNQIVSKVGLSTPPLKIKSYAGFHPSGKQCSRGDNEGQAGEPWSTIQNNETPDNIDHWSITRYKVVFIGVAFDAIHFDTHTYIIIYLQVYLLSVR